MHKQKQTDVTSPVFWTRVGIYTSPVPPCLFPRKIWEAFLHQHREVLLQLWYRVRRLSEGRASFPASVRMGILQPLLAFAALNDLRPASFCAGACLCEGKLAGSRTAGKRADE